MLTPITVVLIPLQFFIADCVPNCNLVLAAMGIIAKQRSFEVNMNMVVDPKLVAFGERNVKYNKYLITFLAQFYIAFSSVMVLNFLLELLIVDSNMKQEYFLVPSFFILVVLIITPLFRDLQLDLQDKLLDMNPFSKIHK